MVDGQIAVSEYSPHCVTATWLGCNPPTPLATLIVLGHHVIRGAPTEGGEAQKCGLKVGSSALCRCVSWIYCREESQPEGKTDAENRVKIRVE